MKLNLAKITKAVRQDCLVEFLTIRADTSWTTIAQVIAEAEAELRDKIGENEMIDAITTRILAINDEVTENHQPVPSDDDAYDHLVGAQEVLYRILPRSPYANAARARIIAREEGEPGIIGFLSEEGEAA